MNTKILLIIIIGLINSNSYSQNKNQKHSEINVDCKSCHTCDVPTKKQPCLVECPRSSMITIHQLPEEAPGIFVLDQLSSKYLPTIFSHKSHAQMIQMTGSCESCHHYNTLGPILSCTNCHESTRLRTDLSKPDLMAAYHRQCIGCHSDWNSKNDCNSCHLPKKGNEKLSDKEVKKYIDKDHPKVETPEKIIFKTNYEKGKLVTFYHSEHVNRFSLSCESCHQNESCTKCHSDQKDLKKLKTLDEHHKPCFSCHGKDACSTCHSSSEKKPFDHFTSTGWQLKSYHQKLSCAKCHSDKKKFEKLNRNCQNCHGVWNTETFDHKVTGLSLDENHSAFDCSECHIDNDFSKSPVCTNCHDDFNYPVQKPGKILKN